MKKRFVIITAILSIFNLTALAHQPTDTNMFGHVVSKQTGEHIPFINITLKGTTIGTATDATGHYFLKNLPIGTFTIVATGIGYKPAEQIVVLTAGESVEVDFEVEEDKILLDGVVVSASLNEIRRREASSIVNILTSSLFENTSSVCLAGGLNFQPGVRVEKTCQTCGFMQVRINGLSGAYSQILIDSRPIFGSLAAVYGLEQFPVNMIERVEVVRGGGSAIFGANAIAGTINIITREPVSNSAMLTNTTKLVKGETMDINTSLNASVVSTDHKSGITLFASSRQRSPFDYNNDGFSEIGQINAKNLGLRGYYNTGVYSKLSFEYHNLGEFRRGGNNFNLPPHEADIAEQIDHNINNGSLKFDIFSRDYKHRFNIFSSAQKVERRSYYGAQQDPNAYGRSDDFIFSGGVKYSSSLDRVLFSPSELTIGAEFKANEMKDEAPGYNRYFSQKISINSILAQNEWKTDKTSVLVGARIDKHNLVKNPVISPRFNLRHGISEAINLRASYSGGFRAPQAFDEDLHIDMVGGAAMLIQLDPELRMERSRSYSASVDLFKNFEGIQTNLLIEGFHTNLDDVFVLEEIGTDGDGNLIMERRNGEGAVVRGINLEGRIALRRFYQFQFGATFQTARYENARSWSDNPTLAPRYEMFRSPNRYGYFTFTCTPVDKFDISLTGTYTGPMLVRHFAGYIAEDREKMTPEFFDLNLRLAYNFELNKHTRLEVNTGVQNILNSYQDDFDRGEFRDAGYIYGPSLPRTLFLGVKFKI